MSAAIDPEMHDLRGRPVIVGAGVAGLMTALLAPEPVVLVSRGPLGDFSSSILAQGGLAASLATDDSPELHCADTLAAGGGLCDERAVRRVVEAAPEAIDRLARLGVAFDSATDGSLRLGLEAAHSRRRIVHAAGDATGRELVRALSAAVRATPSITVMEGWDVRRLLVEDGVIAGLLVAGPAGAALLATGRIVLATGGVGGLFPHTTNPLGSFGQGLALAARAGAVIADPEFVQFHPTALASGTGGALPLISEAVRGEGATLVDENGDRFLAGTPGAELAPRDVVARAVWRHRAAGHGTFLDGRHSLGASFERRFPTIDRLCREAGIDPAHQPIPVRPAAHYHMGGIAVDAEGRSTVPGLWACGEVARTGLHGANRLASNSLTEAMVSAGHVAAGIAAAAPREGISPRAAVLPPAPDVSAVRPVVARALGIVRDGETLSHAIAMLTPLATGGGAAADPALVALMMAVAARRREESRGAHFRADFPGQAVQARPSLLTLDQAFSAAADPAIQFPLARSA